MTELSYCIALHSVQRVRVDKLKKVLVFETEYPNGSVYYFQMTIEQFFSFHDTILIIDQYHKGTHFPLGKNMWCHYSSHRGMILYYCREKVPYFKFQNFEQYKYFTHRRLLSFLRTDGKRTVVHNKDGEERGRVPGANRKRPLSVALQPTDQPTTSATTIKQRGEKDLQTSSGSTDNVVVSPDEETSAVLSKRHHPNPRRWNDSHDVLSPVRENLSSPENVELCHSSDTMDCE